MPPYQQPSSSGPEVFKIFICKCKRIIGILVLLLDSKKFRDRLYPHQYIILKVIEKKLYLCRAILKQYHYHTITMKYVYIRSYAFTHTPTLMSYSTHSLCELNFNWNSLYVNINNNNNNNNNNKLLKNCLRNKSRVGNTQEDYERHVIELEKGNHPA